MAHQINMGAASAVPTFDARAWLDSWTAIGGGFARTSTGLCLFWDAVEDRQARSRLLGRVTTVETSDALLAHLDSVEGAK